MVYVPNSYTAELSLKKDRAFDNIIHILNDARKRVARGVLVVSTERDSSFVTLHETPEFKPGENLDLDFEKRAAYVSRADAPEIALGITRSALEYGTNHIITLQGVFRFRTEVAANVVRALLDASKFRGPQTYFERIIEARPHLLN